MQQHPAAPKQPSFYGAAAAASPAPAKRKKAGAASTNPNSGKKPRDDGRAAAGAAAEPPLVEDPRSSKKRQADGPAAAVAAAGAAAAGPSVVSGPRLGKKRREDAIPPLVAHSSCPTPSTIMYATSDHVLDHQKIETGFTDGGRGSVARLVADCRADPPVMDEREVIEVDLQELSKFISECQTTVSRCSNPRNAFKTLAKMCSMRLGGNRATTDDRPTMKHLNALRSELRSNCVPLHRLKSGVCRHRALLFKILCWECSSPALVLPCRFIRGDFTNSYGVVGHAWNVVRVDNDWFLCDLMRRPGKLYVARSDTLAQSAVFCCSPHVFFRLGLSTT